MGLPSKLATLVGVAIVVVAGRIALDAASDPGLTESAKGTGGPALLIHERTGSVERHALGDRLTEVSAAFGPPGRNDVANARYLPLGADPDQIGAPTTFSFPAACDKPLGGAPKDGTPGARGVTELSFQGVGAGFCRGTAYMFVVSSRGSRTTGGAAIGQSLALARAYDPTLHCGTAPGSTTPPVPVYKFCSAKVAAGRYLWLGQDPISSIAIATVRMGG